MNTKQVWTTHSESDVKPSVVSSQIGGMDNLAYTTDASDVTDYNSNNNNDHRVIPMQGIFSSNSKRKVEADSEGKVIAVIGSGDYGRAVSSRFVKSGYTVFIGSRDPNRASIKKLVRQTGATLVNQDAAVASSDIVLIAVGRDFYDHLPLTLLKGKILIDVSNNTKRRKGPHYKSNAEYLQGMVPESKVVKGFNVLSAYALEGGATQGSKDVYIASDFPEAKQKVSELIRTLGFTPVDWGVLSAARDIEDVPLKLMPSWKRPVAVVTGLFVFHWIVALFQFQICANMKYGDWTKNWKYLGMTNFNRIIGILALWVLSFCYLPGLIAAYIQLWRGTKYSRFPKWLDDWLKMRKQLGLLMLGLAALHGVISLGQLSPQTTGWVYEPPTKIKVNAIVGEEIQQKVIKIDNFHFNWRGELFLTFAGLAMCLTVIIGLSSLPSVTATLSWREFNFIQSKLGWVTLVIASLHDIFLAWNFMFLYWGCFETLPIGPQYALYAPAICLLMKLPLLLPPVYNYLDRIRKGYERSSSSARKTSAKIMKVDIA